MTDLNSKLDSTLNVLGSGLSGLAVESALHSIENWESELQAAGKPELVNIARDLAALRAHLTGNLDGHAIGHLLRRLGEQTTTVAGQAEEGVNVKLHHLGDLLARAGTILAPNP